VVEDDRLLLVQPARVLVDLCGDRLDGEREDLVAQLALLRIEDLALPDHEVDDLLGRSLELAPGRNQDRAVGLPTRDLARRTVSKEGVELLARHLEQLRHVNSHVRSLRRRWGTGRREPNT